MKVVDKIPTMTDYDLLQLYRNAIRLKHKSNNPDIDQVLSAIGDEWEKRLEKYRNGSYKADRPTVGMLGELGYSVGREGASTPVRREILKYVLDGKLPMVGSPAYTDEWGMPRTWKRYNKITKTLRSFLEDPRLQKMKNIEKAMIEWREDLEWIIRYTNKSE